MKGLILHLFLCFGEWVCTLKTAYPFVKHIPIAIVMSISRFRNCAEMCRGGKQQDITLLFGLLGFLPRHGARNSFLRLLGSTQRGDDRQWGQ